MQPTTLPPPRGGLRRRALTVLSAAALAAGMAVAGAGTASAVPGPPPPPGCVNGTGLAGAIDNAATTSVTLCGSTTLPAGHTLAAGHTLTVDLAGATLTIAGTDATATGSFAGQPGLTNNGTLILTNGTVAVNGGAGSVGIDGTAASGPTPGVNGTAGAPGGDGIDNAGNLVLMANTTVTAGRSGAGGNGGNGGNGTDATSAADGADGAAGGNGGTAGNGGVGLSNKAASMVFLAASLTRNNGIAGTIGIAGTPGTIGADYIGIPVYFGGLGGVGGAAGSGGAAVGAISGMAVGPLIVLNAGSNANAPQQMAVFTQAFVPSVPALVTAANAAVTGHWPTSATRTFAGWDTAPYTGLAPDGQTVDALWTGGSTGSTSPAGDPNNVLDPTATSTANGGRIAGADRYATANLIAAHGHWSGKAVIIATGVAARQGIDALSANYLAGQVDAPILLAGPDGLDANTITDAAGLLQSAGANGTVYVMGSDDAVSQQAVNHLLAAIPAASQPRIVRLSGADRYATSALAALAGHTVGSYALTAGSPALKTAFLASGQVNADALTAGPLAYGYNIPVLLTAPGALPTDVASAIRTLGIQQVVIVGGTDRVSTEVQASLTGLGVTNTLRIAAGDRYTTSADLYTWARLPQTAPDGTRQGLGEAGVTAYLANGLTGFTDAVAAGPVAGQQGAALLTVPSSALEQETAAFLHAQSGLTTVTGLGEDGTIAGQVLSAAAASLK